MKKLSILFMSLVAMATTVTSCSKNDNPAPPATALELVIKTNDASATVVANATVKLYGTLADYQGAKNQVGTTQTSGADGKVKFSGLEAKTYYFSVSKADGCLSNALTIPVTYDATTGQAAPIVANKTTSLAIPVEGATGVTFTNNSTTNAWEVSIDTNKFYTIPAGASGTVPMPIGTYTITMQEVDASGNPTATAPKTFDENLSCGGTATVTVP